MANEYVALLAEGVDRNSLMLRPQAFSQVALLAEGVDRNGFGPGLRCGRTASPSSRRAWIEIARV